MPSTAARRVVSAGLNSLAPAQARVVGPLTQLRRQHGAGGDQQEPRYSRIRLKNLDELDKSYHMLMMHFQRGSSASSVREFVLDIALEDLQDLDYYYDLIEAKKPNMVLENDIDEQLLLKAIKTLGLEQKNEVRVTKALIRKKKQLSPESDGLSSARCLCASTDEASYAHYASPLLLTIFPNIRRLTLLETSQPFREFLLRANYGLLPTPQLQKLRHVRYVLKDGLDCYDDREYSGFDIFGELRLFHRLPLIESFSVSGVNIAEEHFTVLPPHVSNLKNITITHSSMSSRDISCVIRLSKALEEFTFSIGGRGTLDGSTEIVVPKTIGKAILSQKESLRRLDLDLDDYLYDRRRSGFEKDDECEDYEEGELRYCTGEKYFELDKASSKGPLSTVNLPNTRRYHNTIGSLHDFEALTHLSIGIKLLLSSDGDAPFRLVDALPRNLEMLVIRGYRAGENTEHTSQINEFMEQRADKLPNLREVQGVEKEIPSSRTLNEMDYDGPEPDQLWKEVEEDNGWLEATR